MDAAKELADLIAEAAARRQRGEPAMDQTAEATRLVIELGAGDDGAIDRFFTALGDGLRARGTTLPPFDELPPSVVPLIAAAGNAFVVGDDGRIDYQRTADNLDETMRQAFGKSPRQVREEQLRAKIRREVSASVAESMRRAGLTPACDQPDDDDDDDPDSHRG